VTGCPKTLDGLPSDVEFGYFLVPNADDYPTVIEQTRIADEAGLDLIGIQDHPSYPGTWMHKPAEVRHRRRDESWPTPNRTSGR
jgi:hypothetical protein